MANSLVALAASPGLNLPGLDQAAERTNAMIRENKLMDIALRNAPKRQAMNDAAAMVQARKAAQAAMPYDVAFVNSELQSDNPDLARIQSTFAEYGQILPQAGKYAEFVGQMQAAPPEQRGPMMDALRQDMSALAQQYPVQTQQEATAPASVREWQYYSQLSPDEQERYLAMKRQGYTLAEIAGGKALVNRNDPSAPPVPLSTPQQEVAAAADRERAVTTAGAEAEADARVRTAPDVAAAEAEAERIAAAPEVIRAAKSQIDTIDGVMSTKLGQAEGAVSGWSAGWGSLLKILPSTDARELSGYVDTIKANLAFDKLQNIRDLAKTGGGLGAISERELDLLGSNVASLDQGQDPEVLRQNLREIAQRYAVIRSNLMDIIAVNEGRMTRDEAFARADAYEAQLPDGGQSEQNIINFEDLP